MSRIRIQSAVIALVCAVTLLVSSNSTTFAQPNNQEGLVNVNIEDLIVQVPVSVAVPVGVAANVCGLTVAGIQEQGNTCVAENNSQALSEAIANAALGASGGPGGDGRNNQSGLVNVNVEDVVAEIPVSVALPIGVAANVCGLTVLGVQEQGNTCRAENTSGAVSQALAEALLA